MNWNIVFAAQALLAGGALVAATLWPSTGDPVVLIPVVNHDRDQFWHWVSAEDAAVISVDGNTVTVRAPSQASLWRAVASGYLPMNVSGAGCTTPQAATEGSNSIS